jgi:hypothetical protein
MCCYGRYGVLCREEGGEGEVKVGCVWMGWEVRLLFMLGRLRILHGISG